MRHAFNFVMMLACQLSSKGISPHAVCHMLSVTCCLSDCGTVQGARKQVLACEPDPAELHRLLTNLPVLGQLSADELCQQAASLFKQSPPNKLASTASLRFTW